jgi:hypothetical protein
MSTTPLSEGAMHTPGPWTAIGGTLSIGVYTAFDGDTPIGSPVHIASCWHNERTPKINGYANARLVAAAPELLAYAKLMAANGDPDAEDLVRKAIGTQP